jgi:putative FmdB family regulatory protein
MPLYDYRCRKCGHAFWIIASLSEHDAHEGAKRVCPRCGSPKVERVIGAVNVHTTKKS